MFNKLWLMGAALALLSMGTYADVFEIPGSGLSKYIISFDNAEKIRITFNVTAEVDLCNSHGLIGELMPITDDYYVAELMVLSTQMFCTDPTTRTDMFTKSFEVTGSYITVLVPENATVTAEPVN